MKKIVRLTESDLIEIVKKVIKEQDETGFAEPDPSQFSVAMNYTGNNSENDGLTEDSEEDVETSSIPTTKVTYQSILGCYKTHTKVEQFPNGFSTPIECRTNPKSENCKIFISNHINKLNSVSPNNTPKFKNCLNKLYGSNSF